MRAIAEERKSLPRFLNTETNPSVGVHTESPAVSQRPMIAARPVPPVNPNSVEEMLRRSVSANIFIMFKYYFIGFMSLLVFTAFRSLTIECNWISFHLTVHCWTVYYVHELVVDARMYRKLGADMETRRRLSFSMTSGSLLIVFLVFLSLTQADFTIFDSYVVTAPLLLAFVLDFSQCAFCKTNCDTLHQVVMTAASFFRLSTVLMSLLKLEGQIESNWATTLWYAFSTITITLIGRCGW